VRSLRSPGRLGLLAAALVAVIAGVHFQQYVDFMSEVPTVGVLFLLNAAGGAGLAVALLSSDRVLRLLAAMGAIGLAAGSLVSIAFALSTGFLGYQEPSLRLPIVVAILAEALALPTLALLAWREYRGGGSTNGPSEAAHPSPRAPAASSRTPD
jgi:hypothetical protein